MAAPPISLFALRLPANGEVVYPEVSFAKDITISSITYADELPDQPVKARSLVRVHHTPIIEDEDDDLFDDDSEGDDDEDPDEDGSDEDQDDDVNESADSDSKKANGGAKKLTLGKHEVDLSQDEVRPVPEEEVHTICALIPNSIETVTGLNVHCAAEDLVGFSVTGPYAVDLIGAYTVTPAGMDQDPDTDEDGDDESIDSDVYGDDSAEDEYYDYDDDDDEDGLDPSLAGLLNPEDSGEDDVIEDPSRFSVVSDTPKKAAGKAAANGKKRGADAAGLDGDGDASMASTSSAAAAGSAAESELTRNQRKRLHKKPKAEEAQSQSADESTASAGSAKAKKVSFNKDLVEGPTPSGTAKPKTDAAAKKDKAAASPAGAAAAASEKKGKQADKPKKITTASGLIIEDVKVGTGPQAKPGQKVGMRYIGKLTNGKQFDANTSGKPFYFKLGRGEVIKGWDEGVKGMTIGSERRLTCPPQLAYGSQKVGGIPPNSTLVFDIKLVDIK